MRTAAKQAIREWITAEMVAAEPSLVLDLWGGGKSARMLAGAGLSVLSVDDGRSPVNTDTPMLTDSVNHRYQIAVGEARDYAKRCDAAWLDFCGHWCPDASRTIRACSHMKILFVTLMPERTPTESRLSTQEWQIILKALVADASKMNVTSVKKYKRTSGRWAFVFACRQSTRSARLARNRERWRSDPQFREDLREAKRRWASRPETKQRILVQDRMRGRLSREASNAEA